MSCCSQDPRAGRQDASSDEDDTFVDAVEEHSTAEAHAPSPQPHATDGAIFQSDNRVAAGGGESDTAGADGVQLPPEIDAIVPDLSPEDIESRVADAEEIKREGNTLFGHGDWSGASAKYAAAVALCPKGRNEASVYHGNLAACQIKLEKYADAVASCATALELDKDYDKVRLRRAQANERVNTWASLTSAKEDYDHLIAHAPPPLSTSARQSLARLAPRLAEAEEREKAEMMGKLKDLGNMFLGKFGMSVDDFKMEQGPGGGYSLNMGTNK